MAFTLVTVTGRFLRADGITPAEGEVLFKLTQSLYDTDTGDVIAPATQTAVMDENGEIEIVLVATDDPTTIPQPVQYEVTEHHSFGRTVSYLIEIPSADPTLDLTTAVHESAVYPVGSSIVSAVASKVARAGDTMTGPLILPGDPPSALAATPRQYVDAQVLAAIAGVQPLDADLTAIAALTTTDFGRALLELADAGALRTAAGLSSAATHAATDFDPAGAAAAAQAAAIAASQPLDSDLTAIAALSTTAYGRSVLTAADAGAALSILGISAFAQTILDDADAAAVRATIGAANNATSAPAGTSWPVYVDPATASLPDAATTINAALATGLDVVLPEGVFVCGSSLGITRSSQKLTGQGPGKSTIRFTNPSDSVIEASGNAGATYNYVGFEDFDIYVGISHTGCGTTNGSPTVTDTSVVAGDFGKSVTGVGVPVNTYVGTVTPGVGFQLSSASGSQVDVNATATGTVTLTVSANNVVGIDWTYFSYSTLRRVTITQHGQNSTGINVAQADNGTGPYYNTIDQYVYSGGVLATNTAGAFLRSGDPNHRTANAWNIRGGRWSGCGTGWVVNGEGHMVQGVRGESITGVMLQVGDEGYATSAYGNTFLGICMEGSSTGQVATFASTTIGNTLRTGTVTGIATPQVTDSSAGLNDLTPTGIIARTEYNPAGSVTKTTTSSTFADVDATNLKVTFVAPLSGVVEVVLQGYAKVASTATTHSWNLRDNSGDIAGTSRTVINTVTNSRLRVGIKVSGLNAGQSYTWKWGFASFDNTNTVSLTTGTTNLSPAVMEVWAVNK